MEKVLKEKELEVKLIPVPRVISSSCGLAARTLAEDIDKIKEIAAAEEIGIDGSYIMTDGNDIRPV